MSSVAAGAAAAACEAIEDAKPEPSRLPGEGADEEVISYFNRMHDRAAA